MANEVKYTDQTWTGGTPIDGETLSVNGYYTGEHLGTPLQGNCETEYNGDPHYTQHKTIRYGTILQDGSDGANMPVEAEE